MSARSRRSRRVAHQAPDPVRDLDEVLRSERTPRRKSAGKGRGRGGTKAGSSVGGAGVAFADHEESKSEGVSKERESVRKFEEDVDRATSALLGIGGVGAAHVSSRASESRHQGRTPTPSRRRRSSSRSRVSHYSSSSSSSSSTSAAAKGRLLQSSPVGPGAADAGTEEDAATVARGAARTIFLLVLLAVALLLFYLGSGGTIPGLGDLQAVVLLPFTAISAEISSWTHPSSSHSSHSSSSFFSPFSSSSSPGSSSSSASATQSLEERVALLEHRLKFASSGGGGGGGVEMDARIGRLESMSGRVGAGVSEAQAAANGAREDAAWAREAAQEAGEAAREAKVGVSGLKDRVTEVGEVLGRVKQRLDVLEADVAGLDASLQRSASASAAANKLSGIPEGSELAESLATLASEVVATATSPFQGRLESVEAGIGSLESSMEALQKSLEESRSETAQAATTAAQHQADILHDRIAKNVSETLREEMLQAAQNASQAAAGDDGEDGEGEEETVVAKIGEVESTVAEVKAHVEEKVLQVEHSVVQAAARIERMSAKVKSLRSYAVSAAVSAATSVSNDGGGVDLVGGLSGARVWNEEELNDLSAPLSAFSADAFLSSSSSSSSPATSLPAGHNLRSGTCALIGCVPALWESSPSTSTSTSTSSTPTTTTTTSPSSPLGPTLVINPLLPRDVAWCGAPGDEDSITIQLELSSPAAPTHAIIELATTMLDIHLPAPASTPLHLSPSQTTPSTIAIFHHPHGRTGAAQTLAYVTLPAPTPATPQATTIQIPLTVPEDNPKARHFDVRLGLQGGESVVCLRRIKLVSSPVPDMTPLHAAVHLALKE